jgi:hypothetical protein
MESYQREPRTHMRKEVKLEELGLVLPEAPKLPPGVQVSFACLRVQED